MSRLFPLSLATAFACLATSLSAAPYTIVVQGDTIRGTLKEQLESSETATRFGDYGFKIPENHHKVSTFLGAKYHARVASKVYLPTTGLGSFNGNLVRHGAEVRLALHSRSTDNIASKSADLLHEADNVVVNGTATLEWSTAVPVAEGFLAEWGYQLRPFMDGWMTTHVRNGVYGYELAHQAHFTFDGDQNDLILKSLNWFDNVYEGAFDTIKETVRKQLKRDRSQHTKEERRKLKWTRGVGGARASADTLGVSIRTASPGYASYAFTLPNANSLAIPAVFLENAGHATVTISFDGQALGSFSGADYPTDELASLVVDISSVKGRTGELRIAIDSDGPGSSRIYIPDTIEGFVDMNGATIPTRSAVSGSGASVSVESRADAEYTLQRSTDLVDWTDVETQVGTGGELTIDFDLFDGLEGAAFYRIESTEADFTPSTLPTGSEFMVSPEYSKLTVLSGGAFVLDLGDGEFVEGTFVYEELSNRESALAATVPDDTSLNTVFTLLWETPTSGSISATGALDYGYSEGVKFSFAPGAE